MAKRRREESPRSDFGTACTAAEKPKTERPDSEFMVKRSRTQDAERSVIQSLSSSDSFTQSFSAISSSTSSSSSSSSSIYSTPREGSPRSDFGTACTAAEKPKTERPDSEFMVKRSRTQDAERSVIQSLSSSDSFTQSFSAISSSTSSSSSSSSSIYGTPREESPRSDFGTAFTAAEKPKEYPYAALAKALKDNKSLHTLDLDGNNVGAKGAAALATALKDNKSLHTLDLGRNDVGDGGAAALATALTHNTSLHTLKLSSNSIGAKGAAALATALTHNTSLHTLDLGTNYVGAEGAAALAKALKDNKSLHTLDLSWNDVGDGGLMAILEALKTNCALTSIDFGDDCSSEIPEHSIIAKIKSKLKYNNDMALQVTKYLKQFKDYNSELGSDSTPTKKAKAFTLEDKTNLVFFLKVNENIWKKYLMESGENAQETNKLVTTVHNYIKYKVFGAVAGLSSMPKELTDIILGYSELDLVPLLEQTPVDGTGIATSSLASSSSASSSSSSSSSIYSTPPLGDDSWDAVD